MKFGSYEISVVARTPGGEKYVSQAEATEETVDSAGMEIFSDQAYRAFIRTLNEAYDGWEFQQGPPSATRDLERRLIWEKVKNINTDEELEEIREILRINEKDLF